MHSLMLAQDVPSGPVNPSAQMQLALPAADVAPVSQLMQSPARLNQKMTRGV